ncbi:hypothetical protein [Marinifilum caeruleilacunae]|uniref:Uncharacterized protein n=1 Tax=Marinifilum caeruleilacunae TaxID=2499076 RepID=A0ABX1WY22_9BACT|nr:hypothetical protein [Marinifilum caeruleilacunae]NOU60997.1 hypothetical protein [Marinifilum caeruleilacunae]
MKKILSLIVFAFAFAGMANAQQNQTVTSGSDHTYTANPQAGTTPDHYVWQVVDGSDVAVIDLTGETGATLAITWDAVNFTVGQTYRLKSQVVDDNNCISEVVYVDVTIAAEAFVNFAAAATNVITCSDLNGGVSGGLADQSLFELEFTGGVGPYEVTYEIRDASNAVVQGPTTVPNLNNGDDLTINNNFVNETGADVNYTVVITEAKTNDGADVTVNADNSRTITVHTKPVIMNLTLN